jgi:hypothetical protein
MSNDNAMSFYALTSAFVRKALMLSFGSGYKTGKSPRACTSPLRLYHPVLIEQRSVAGLSFGVIAWSAWIDMKWREFTDRITSGREWGDHEADRSF